jgi:hypothetical protein
MKKIILLLILINLISSGEITQAQFRNYGLIYSDNIKGNTTMFGNTLMALSEYTYDSIGNITGEIADTIAMNDSRATGNSIYGNDNSLMNYVSTDPALFNSSSSDLILPSGTNTIKMARLYWGGGVSVLDFDITQPTNQTIKIRKGSTGSYTQFAASTIDKLDSADDEGFLFWQYQASVDITQFISSNGEGTYTVGGAVLSQGDGGAQYYGGWCIVVVYENTSQFATNNAIRVYDGYQRVLDTSITVKLSGLDVPANTLNLTDAQMGAMVWEGDANITGDYFKINGNLFSNAVNPPDNPWNGSISTNGVFVTTKLPNFTNQMSIDIDQFYIGTGYGIEPNTDTALLNFGSEGDAYFPGVFTFVIKTNGITPVTLTNFTAALSQSNEVKIDWSTSEEINCKKYEVQRSADGINFITIASVPGSGNSDIAHSYTTTDNIQDVSMQVIYYRLAEIDIDGQINYSKTVAVKLEGNTDNFQVSPNPFSNYIQLNLQNRKNEIAIVKIYDAVGRVLITKQIQLVNGSNFVSLDGLSKLSSGTYVIQLNSSEGSMVKKIIKP